MSHPDPTKTYDNDHDPTKSVLHEEKKIKDCICDETMDVACPHHGQDALLNKTGYYEEIRPLLHEGRRIKEELEWLRRRLHGHSFDGEKVNLEYVDARIDDIITTFLKMKL